MSVSAVLSNRTIEVSRAVEVAAEVRVERGLSAMFAMQGELVALAQGCGQKGALDYLQYFLTGPYGGAKVPHAVLVSREGGDGEPVGVVLVQEYQMAGAGTGIFMTDDETGERTVMARPEQRAWVAGMAAKELFRGGARLVLMTLDAGAAGMGEAFAQAGAGVQWEILHKQMDRYLPLAETLEGTLATLGKHTRRNLRYYRRKVEERMGCVFVPDVEMSREEFVELNRVCSYPVPDEVAGWRYDATQAIAGRLFVGLKAADGQWLSLLGGRHHHDMTAVAWQMNRESMVAESLSTVMRSYLLEYEVERGTRRLSFDGGTPHSIHHAFVTSEVTYAVATKRSVGGWMAAAGVTRMLPKNNFLRRVMEDAGLQRVAG